MRESFISSTNRFAIIIIIATSMCVLFVRQGQAEKYEIIFPDKIKTEDVIPRTYSDRLPPIEVGRFNSIEAINLSNEIKYLVPTANYTKAIISMFGYAKGPIQKECKAGLIMFPDEKEIISAWSRDRAFILTNEISTNVHNKSKYFEGQIEIDIAFPQYILGFYNTCNSNIELNVYYTLK